MTIKHIPYRIAVDGGGTGCRAILTDGAGNILGRATGGPANIGADTPAALAHIIEAAEQAAANAGLEVAVLSEARAVLGLAGANSLANREAHYNALPFGQVRIVSDAVTALQGALGDGDGVMVIVGTGSAFIKRTGETIEIVGGRGFMLSDHAGGARLGRELLEEALLVADGMAARSELIDAALAQFKNDAREITTFSRNATAADYAALAPLVFKGAMEGDPVGLSITQRACDSLRRGLDRLGVEEVGRFSMTGGLANAYAALPCLPHRALYKPPLGDALQGALALALRDGQ
ncbi:ATPase [Ochrobactrum sp. P6BS-III]|uniref:BadF/BadG/BcrA/BcrD ATPase family protein n=1 Tax=unclassified Ochrobactrum TaxID=239106 RepID=UPI000991D862|nr:glucosamine kinase [Ochrobactrum sp. P6BSIII]OOL14906.1 ATPase [Ochrobactrum sp. P6BS-III]